ncbi:hypothetical protein OAH97_01470 [Octadecabacter sp.]|nr:hypothetical protein [Octadecabacter sp.]
MQRPPPFPFLPDLERPLRDAMRGVANFAEATEEALQPAAQLLPEALREGFEKAVKSIEITGRQWTNSPVDHDQILDASAFALGNTMTATSAKHFAKVFCFAWEELQNRSGADRYLISETLIANAADLIRPGQSGPASSTAVRLLNAIQDSHAIGRLPGFATSLESDKRSNINIGLVTVMVWLLSARAGSIAEEIALLDLAGALIMAIRSDIDAAMDTPKKLAIILQNTSAHL